MRSGPRRVEGSKSEGRCRQRLPSPSVSLYTQRPIPVSTALPDKPAEGSWPVGRAPPRDINGAPRGGFKPLRGKEKTSRTGLWKTPASRPLCGPRRRFSGAATPFEVSIFLRLSGRFVRPPVDRRRASPTAIDFGPSFGARADPPSGCLGARQALVAKPRPKPPSVPFPSQLLQGTYVDLVSARGHVSTLKSASPLRFGNARRGLE